MVAVGVPVCGDAEGRGQVLQGLKPLKCCVAGCRP